MQPKGIFKDGDLWYGSERDEEGYWPANYPTSNPEDGADYGTQEQPELFTAPIMNLFPASEAERFSLEYSLAKQIGDKRFGSECKHSRSKRGYCPDCLRKVL